MEAEINVKNADPGFKFRLMDQSHGIRISACYTCRSCVSGCPVACVNPDFSPARIIRMANFGLKQEVLSSEFIWLCTSCYTCQEACPMGVRITDFIIMLKNLAGQEGHAPQGVRAQVEIIEEHSRIYPIDDFDNKKRKKIGLPSLPIQSDVAKQLFDIPQKSV